MFIILLSYLLIIIKLFSLYNYKIHIKLIKLITQMILSKKKQQKFLYKNLSLYFFIKYNK